MILNPTINTRSKRTIFRLYGSVCSALLFFFLLFPFPIHSEPVWFTRHFKPSDDLAFQIVRDIALAPDGAIWFATWGGGLSRFDGSHWQTYNKEKTISDYMIRALAFDQYGNLWAGTVNGIQHFDGDEWKFYSKETVPNLDYDSVFTILPRKNGEIWFGMNGGYLYSYDPQKPESDRWRLVRDTGFFRKQGIRDCIELEDGSVWICGDGIYYYDEEDKDWTVYTINEHFYSICHLQDGRILAAGASYLYQFDGETWTVIEKAMYEPRSIVQTADGSILVGSRTGVQIGNHGIWKDFELSDDFSHPYVEVIRELEDGSIWIGTRNGVYLARQSDWSVFPDSSIHSSVFGRRFFSSKKFKPRIANSDSQIFELQGEEWISAGMAGGEYGELEEILNSSEQRLTVWKQNAIVEYLTPDLSIERIIPIPETLRHRKVYQTPDGAFWLYGEEDFFQWTESEWKPYESSSTRENKRIQLFRETSDGTRWVAYRGSVEAIGKDYEFLNLFSTPGYSNRHITEIIHTKDGSIWFGTSGAGIVVYKEGKTTKYTTKNGLPSNWIFCIFESSDGTIWAGMDDSSAASFRDGRWISFTQKEIQLRGHVTRITEDPDGAIWFAVESTGLARYLPSTDPPQTEIQDFTQHLTENSAGVFSFRGWDTWHNTHPSELVYSWRITKIGKEGEIVPWKPYTTQTIVSTPRLFAGHYIFEVKAADKERNADPTPDSIPFTVEPFFYKKSGFWIPVLLCALTTLISIGFVLIKHRALLASEKWLSQAQSIAHIGHWIYDIQRGMLAGSDEFYKILGVSRNEMSSTTQSIRQIIHPLDYDYVQSEIRGILVNQQAADFEHRIIQPNGNIRTIHVRADIKINGTENSTRLLGVIQDITEKRRLEEEAQKAQKLESIGILAGGIAHDFNNLLTAIIGNIALAKYSLPRENDAYKRLLDSEKASHRAQDLTKQLLTFSAGNRPIKKKCSIEDVVRSGAQIVLENSSVQCKFNAAGDLWPVNIDQGQIKQVVRNIILNAVQAMSDEGIIYVKLENIHINNEFKGRLCEGDYVKISITDTGCGIPPNDLPKIYDPYFTTKDHVTQKGLGLGLAICFSIIKLHHGLIDAVSEVGKGTTFTFYLPAQQ